MTDYSERGSQPHPPLDQEIHAPRLAPGKKRALLAFLRASSGRIREGLE